jgi:hypothetical protein
MSMNSISPWNSDELVPPRMNEPPGSSSCGFLAPWKRVSQKDISGASSWPLETSPSQKGVVCVEEMPSNARPMMPDTEPLSSPLVICSTDTVMDQHQVAATDVRAQDVQKPCFVKEKLPMLTLSDETKPATFPEP